MEKEVKRKAVAYGTSAILIGLILAAFAYNFGFQPVFQPTLSEFKTFSSYNELENFLKSNMDKAKTFSSEYQLLGLSGGQEANLATAELRAAPEYSTTNVQVAGVDEADIVKTDGTYLYVVSGNSVYIIDANPFSTSGVLQKITLNETYGLEIYTLGNKLAIIGSRYPYPVYRDVPGKVASYSYIYTEEVIIKIYDLQDIANPALKRTITLNGTLSGSRMIDNYIYVSVVQPAISPIVYTEPYPNNETLPIILPQITTDNTTKEIQATEIRYINVTDVSYYFTTIVAVNILDDAQEPTHETFLAGTGAQMYVSQNNMYLTVPNMNWWLMRTTTGEVKEETLIYRVKLDREKVTFQAQGAVQGYVLNQFSMDEYNDFFRVATTVGWGMDSVNNVYVLNMSLSIVGKLEDIPETRGERIYSARFMGNRAYLVTFRQVDPFFVIDLTDQTAPKVLGFLKIPGFSGYLHPYDENYIIGVGKQGSNVKLSLFDVTNVTAPVEAVSSFIVEATWSDSTVLYDHKAFLFDKPKQLLALPISVNWGYYDAGSWQGEYVFNLSLTNGFQLRGNITHQESGNTQWDSSLWVKRALYIDNIIYTVSDKKVKMNNLTTLDLIKEVLLN